jgi:hypothetical protein
LQLRESVTDSLFTFDRDDLCGVISQFRIHWLARFTGQQIDFSILAFDLDRQSAPDEVARIRASGAFDGLIDFDAVVRDPNHPSQLSAKFASQDHLHPNDEGYKAMADSIDLDLFK